MTIPWERFRPRSRLSRLQPTVSMISTHPGDGPFVVLKSIFLLDYKKSFYFDIKFYYQFLLKNY